MLNYSCSTIPIRARANYLHPGSDSKEINTKHRKSTGFSIMHRVAMQSSSWNNDTGSAYLNIPEICCRDVGLDESCQCVLNDSFKLHVSLNLFLKKKIRKKKTPCNFNKIKITRSKCMV